MLILFLFIAQNNVSIYSVSLKGYFVSNHVTLCSLGKV